MITTNLREQNAHTELKTGAVSVVDQTHAETEVHTGPHIPAIQ